MRIGRKPQALLMQMIESEAEQKAAQMQAAEAEKAVKAPIATLYGEPLEKCPAGLFIPPEALRVFLARFEGPLDLLLFLIRSQKFDPMDIPMAVVAEQYMAYMEVVRRESLELASAYLVMAATLMSIKSRMLLPAKADDSEEEPEDPRAELMRRLLAYEKIKKAALLLDELPRCGRDFLPVSGAGAPAAADALPEIDLQEIGEAWLDVVARLRLSAHHHVARSELSVRERMSMVLKRLSGVDFLTYQSLVDSDDAATRMSAAVWYLALLELGKDALVRLAQSEPYAPIYAKLAEKRNLLESGGGFEAPGEAEAAADAGSAAADAAEFLKSRRLDDPQEILF